MANEICKLGELTLNSASAICKNNAQHADAKIIYLVFQSCLTVIIPAWLKNDDAPHKT